MECYDNAENELFNGDSAFDGQSDKIKYKALTSCHCLPQCESLKYEIELVKTDYKSDLADYMTIASLKVFFKGNDFVSLKRFQLYGTVDFLANCGMTSLTSSDNSALFWYIIEINSQVVCSGYLLACQCCRLSRFCTTSSCGKENVLKSTSIQLFSLCI